MKLIKPSVEIIPQSEGLEGIYKQIEKAGRTCYKSEDKITEDSAKKFVDMLANNKHGAMLEHGTVYLSIPIKFGNHVTVEEYLENPYSRVGKDMDNHNWCITTNLRVLTENDWLEDLQYICEPTEHHMKRVTVKFTIDNGIMREFTRHRTMSFACESTRYCNYSKSKFDSNVTYVIPSWIELDEQTINEPIIATGLDCYFLNGLLEAEDHYVTLLQEGWKPQQARAVLPLATKCDLIMTGFIDDWRHFLSLRSSDYGATGAHPDASYIANKLYAKLREENYLS